LSVAVNQIRRGPDGERQENTEWFRVSVSGPRGDFAQRLQKGNRVLVAGRLQISHYTTKDGEPRTGFDVWADDFESVSLRPRDAEPLPGAEADVADAAESGEPVAAPAGAGGTVNGNGRKPVARAATADLEDLPF
jgi:single stranded DNA-binding protein